MNYRKLYPGGKKKALTLSYDDGVYTDRRLVSLMKQYGILGTFNLNSQRRPVPGRIDNEGNRDFRMEPEEIGDLYEGFEIAAHSCTHPFLEQLPERKLYEELFLDQCSLERWYHQKIIGLALPFGTHNEAVDRAVRQLGFLYCRTTHSTHSFFPPAQLPILDPTCRHREPELMDLGRKFLQTDQELALFYLWGHSFEFELNGNWEIIEAFLSLISGKEDIWYGTNGQILSYLQAMDRLIAGEDFFINPTDQDLWISAAGRTMVVPAGQWVNV